MKRKGFTLIELIVVIAIIGVLAAILAPTMLGNIMKSRIQSANVTSKEAYKYVNIALEEASDDVNWTPIQDGVYGFNTGLGTALEEVDAAGSDTMADALADQSDSLTTEEFVVYIEGGYVVCAAAKNGKYYGTYPAVLGKSNYDMLLTDKSLKGALKLAYKELTGNELTNI